MKLKQLIRKQDMFGYRVELNFNKKGSTHKTMCGGLTSILVLCLMMAYVIINVKKLVLQEDDTLKSIIVETDIEKVDPVLLNETNLELIFRITNAKNMLIMNESEYGSFFKVKATDTRF
jgi:hypothetical protein